MATTNIATHLIRRSAPSVRECFRRGYLHTPMTAAATALSHSPQLVVLFTWIGAKEKNVYKFVNAWKKRGFHVLHVPSTALDLVRPKTGCEITAGRVADFLVAGEQRDFKVIFHGLSVGGYLSQRTLMGLQGTDVLHRLTSIVYDSFTHIAGFQSGVESVVPHPYKGIVNSALKLYTKYADLSCFYEACKFTETVPAPCPTLFMHSLADRVGRYDTIEYLFPLLARGSPVSTFILPEDLNVDHVALFRHLGEGQYMSSIIRFLKRNQFSALQNEVLQEEDPSSEVELANHSRVQDVMPVEE